MADKFRAALAQGNFKVGDIKGNNAKILDLYKQAVKKKADIVIFSEMAITGYPAEDLVLRPKFQDEAISAIHELVPYTKNSAAMIVGGLWREAGKIYNAAFFLQNGKIENIVCKYDLPNYGVFDEKRVFTAGKIIEPIVFKGIKLGLMVCEDMWNLKVSGQLAKKGAEILVSINASPYELDKEDSRVHFVKSNVHQTELPFIYVNQIGGQDELVFDGGSFIMDASGKVVHQDKWWDEVFSITDWKKTKSGWVCKKSKIEKELDKYKSLYAALKLSLKDYVEKNGFPGVVIGMSGGIDSAISAAVAVDCLGRERVRLIFMPSEFTSRESFEDASECAQLLGVKLEEIDIKEGMRAYKSMLMDVFYGTKEDVTEENIQSRIRGGILMAISNKFGSMVLTTGNKSEMAVGYATLYGDMCGGYNILKDLYKTEIFALTKWRNKQGRVIPERIITKPPTAELRHNQRDDDSLPPYEILDEILIRLIEKRQSSDDIIKDGFESVVVEKVARLLKIAEYKRRQSPPGVKLSKLAFGKDRRYPITSGFKM